MPRPTVLNTVREDLDENPFLLLEDVLVEAIQQQLVSGYSVESEIPFKEYSGRPVAFVEEVLKERVTPQQKLVLESLVGSQETNVQSANSIGKSFIAARIILFWVFAEGGLCVSTAPTEGQLKEILWSEVRKAYQKAEHVLGGRCSTLSLRFSEWARAYGFVARDYDANAFQGKHGQKLLLILEEACGISREIDEAAEACVTGSENRILRIGNPIKDNTPFSEACARTSIILNAWEHPNAKWAYEMAADGIHRLKPEVRELIVSPEYQEYYRLIEEGQHDAAQKALPSDLRIPPIIDQPEWSEDLPQDVVPGAISISWIERQRISKGESSAFWQTRIEGRFAEDTESSLIPRAWFNAARKRYDDNPRYWDALASHFPPRHGLDVGDGGDEHARATWRGSVLYLVEERPTINDRLDVDRAADWGYSLLRQYPTGVLVVDRVGVGAGALAKVLRQLNNTYQGVSTPPHKALGYAAGARDKSIVSPQYANQISQDLWLLREDMRLGLIAIAPLGAYEERLKDELAKTYWGTNASDQIAIEEKKYTKKRLQGRSPNVRDAVAMARAKSRLPIELQADSRSSISIGDERSSSQLLKAYK